MLLFRVPFEHLFGEPDGILRAYNVLHIFFYYYSKFCLGYSLFSCCHHSTPLPSTCRNHDDAHFKEDNYIQMQQRIEVIANLLKNILKCKVDLKSTC